MLSLWYRLFSLVLPLGILIGGGFLLVKLSRDPARFPLHAIEIQGQIAHLNKAELQRVISQHMEQGFFWLNVNKVQKSIAALPWADTVEVQRVWPDRIKVTITEQVPQAVWNEVGILSTSGNIFYPELSSLPSQFPHFNGPETRAKEMLQQYFAFLEMLTPLGLSISELNVAPDGTWKISLSNGIAIILGKAALHERLSRFMSVYPGTLKLKAQTDPIAYIDLRYTNGVAIGWK